MPDNYDLTPIQASWLGFTKSVRLLVVPLPDDRPLDQYLAFRDSVFDIVQSPLFLEGLSLINDPPHPLRDKINAALLLELDSFPRAVEVAQATEKPETGFKGWVKRMLGKGSTVAGSVKDVANCTPVVKSGITLFTEMCDLFKGEGH